MILKPGNEPAGKALETSRIIVLLYTDLQEEDNVTILLNPSMFCSIRISIVQVV